MGKKEVDEYAKGLVKASQGGRDLQGNDVLADGSAIGLPTFDVNAVAELSKRYDAIPTVVTLQTGQGFEARLIGNGPPIQTAPKLDPRTGAPKESQRIDTWVFELDNGIRFRVMGTYELNAALPQMVNQRVAVVRLADVRAGQNIVTKYFIGTAKPAAG